MDEMRGLPDPSVVQLIEDVQAAFHLFFLQAEDEAKAVIKGGRTIDNIPIPSIYWPVFRVSGVRPIHSRPAWGTHP